LADNRIALNAGWDREQLEIELASLPDILSDEGLDIGISGLCRDHSVLQGLAPKPADRRI
jgi:hypothetical protein